MHTPSYELPRVPSDALLLSAYKRATPEELKQHVDEELLERFAFADASELVKQALLGGSLELDEFLHTDDDATETTGDDGTDNTADDAHDDARRRNSDAVARKAMASSSSSSSGGGSGVYV